MRWDSALSIATSVLCLGVAVWTIMTVRRARLQILQIQRLYEQMEEDHGELVAKIIKVDNPKYKRTFGPGGTHLP